MSISARVLARWVEATVTVPCNASYDAFDHTPDWRTVVFSNGRVAIECRPMRVFQNEKGAELTIKLRQHDYERLCIVIG